MARVEREQNFIKYEKQMAINVNQDKTEDHIEVLLSSVKKLGDKVSQKQRKRAESWTVYGISQEEAYSLCKEAPGKFKSDGEKIKFLFVDKHGRIRRNSLKNYVPFITRSETKKLLLNDINTIEYEEGHLYFNTVDKQKSKMIGDQSYVYQYLNRDFCHSSKKRIVNMSNVVHLTSCNIIFENGETCETCASNFHEFRHAYNDYLTEH